MLTESHINKKKPALKLAKKNIKSCKPGEKVGKVIDRMISGNITRMHVLKDKQFRGFITDRSVLSLLGAGPRSENFKSLNVWAKRAALDADARLDRKDTLGDALELFRKHDTEALPVISRDKFLGVLSRKDVMHRIKKPTEVKVRDIMSERVFSAQDDWPVFDVAKTLCRGAFRRIPVTRKDILMGIVTPHDIVSHLSENKKLEKLKRHRAGVSEVMNRDVVTVRPDSDVADAVSEMRNKNLKFLPVTEDRELLGVLTETDVLRVFR